jgi:signal transduction histidine kinase/ligand-binding sensor domain-containing protein/CheY-like chemotaxis protein
VSVVKVQQLGGRSILLAVVFGIVLMPEPSVLAQTGAQTAVSGGSDLQHVRFQPLHGGRDLPPVSVNAMLVDARGSLWLGTDAGLCRFDGKGMGVFLNDRAHEDVLRGEPITVMVPGSKGHIWVGTGRGALYRFDLASGLSTQISSRGLPGDKILSLLVDLKGDLWVGTDQGLARMPAGDGEITDFRSQVGSGRVSALTMSAEGDVWVGMFDGGLFSMPRGAEAFLKVWQSSTPIVTLANAAGAGIWIGTQGGGVSHFDPASRSVVAGTGVPGCEVPGRMIEALYQDGEGHLWVSLPQGLARIDTRAGRSTVYRHDPSDPGSLPGNVISSLCEDRSGGLWVGTADGLVSRVNLKAFGFTHVRLDDNAESETVAGGGAVWGFSEDKDGSVWVASESGLRRWHLEQGWMPQPVSLPARSSGGNGAPFVQALCRDAAGDLWAGTRGDGLYRLRADGGVDHLTRQPDSPAGLPHDSVTALHVDAKNRLWVGTMGGGVARWMGTADAPGFLAALTDNSGLSSDDADRAVDCRHVSAMTLDQRGRTWVGSLEGLFLLDSEVGKLVPHRAVEGVGKAVFSADAVTTLHTDSKGHLWVGTLGLGLDRLDLTTGEVVHFSRSANGLPDERIASVIEDGAGILWVSTGEGIGRLDPATGEARRFDEMDGLLRGTYHPGAAIRLQTGALLFGGADGFNLIEPDQLPPERLSPPPVLGGLEISGETVLPRVGGVLEKPLAETERLRLSYDQVNRVAFHLTSGELTASGPEYFRYRLVGQDPFWNVAGKDQEAVYTSLRPGKYRFEAQSSADGRNWNEETVGLDVVVRPPWQRTWWAYLLYIIGTGLALWGAVSLIGLSRSRYHRRLIERAEQQRDRAEAELARQLQHALLLDQAGRELGQNRDPSDLFKSALKIVAQQFDALRCSIVACPGDHIDGGGDVCDLFLLADYQGTALSGDTPALNDVDATLSAALRDVLGNSEMAIIPWGSPASRSGSLKTIADRWSPTGGFILRRTSFLDQPNGAIILQRPEHAGGLESVDLQTLESLSNQLGVAIAQWRVARQDRLRREALDAAREAAESANRAKSDFLAKMTHELRTPLNAILGFSEVMNEDSDLNDRQREVMAIINNSGEHLHEVINGVLDLAKIEAGKIEIHPARFELERMLRSLHKMLSLRARSQGLAFPFEMVTALPRMIETDKSKLRQILINLIGNAIKFTEAGSVTLSTWAEVTGETLSERGLRRRPVRLYFEVRDTGKGIAPGEIAGLFDQYTQTESGKGAADSTGLGLTIAKAFAELLGGGISVESAVGTGTTFRLHICCEEISASNDIDIVSATPGPAGRRPFLVEDHSGQSAGGRSLRRIAPGQPEVRILIAEDQMPNRLLLRKLLEPAGFILREAEDGLAAVEMSRKWQPHLILMDEQMPRMTGREATRAIVAEAEETGAETVPVIVALTAMALDQSRSAAIEAGCSDFLAKPFRRDELFGVLSRNLPYVRFDSDEAETGTVALAG